MDEYLFLTMAKLKVDRLKFERERESMLLRAPETIEHTDARTDAAHESKTHGVSGLFGVSWREQS